jgi:chromosome partitioning protein
MSSSSSAVVIAITNQKGGVGKTTSTINLAQAFAAVGHRVLLIDLDPQGNATQGLGLNLGEIQGSVAELIRDRNLPDEAGIYRGPGLDLIPATPLLGGLEREMPGMTSSEFRLAHRIRRLQPSYDYILIDTAPGFGSLMKSALNAAEFVVVPVDSSFFGLAGIQKLLGEMELIREGYNPGLKLLGLFLTVYDATKMSEEIREELRESFGTLVCDVKIRRSVRLREAPALGRTIFQHAPGSSGAEDYLRLSHELASRLSDSKAPAGAGLRLVSSAAEVSHV